MVKCKRGGKMKAKFIKQFVQSTYKPEKRTPEIDGYKLDESLSDEYITTYWNDEHKKGVVSVRPTDDMQDIMSDVKIFLNMYKRDARFVKNWRLLDKAGRKYKFENLTGIGYSLGAYVLEKYKNAPKFKEIFLVSKPVAFQDLKDFKPLPNATEIRSKIDIVSALKPLQEEAVKTELIEPTTMNPIKEHKIEHIFKELDDDKEIGFGVEIDKMKVSELKRIIKKLRKGHASQFPISGKKKKELISMVDELLQKGK